MTKVQIFFLLFFPTFVPVKEKSRFITFSPMLAGNTYLPVCLSNGVLLPLSF